MSARKTIFSITAFVGVLIFGGGILLYMNLGDVAKVLAEKIATETLGVPVHITHMDIDIPNQTLRIENIRIDNPPGYKSPYAMKIGSVTMQGVKLSRELLALGSIDVQNSDIVLDVKGQSSNLKDIADAAQKNKNSAATKPAAQEPGSKAANAPIKVAIRRVTIADTKLTPAGLLAQTGANQVNVDPITITGIGSETNAVLTSQAINQIWQQVFKAVMRSAVSQSLLNDLSKDLLGDLTEGTGISLQNLGDDLKAKGQDALKKLFR